MNKPIKLWEKILFRIIGFPFFASLALIACLRAWIKYCINFFRYGGEAIAYTEKSTPIHYKTIIDDYVNSLSKQFNSYQDPKQPDIDVKK